MKKLLVIAVLLVSVLSFGQTKTVSILKEKAGQKYIGEVSVEYLKVVDLETNDSRYYAYISFQNKEYTTITDIKLVSFSKQVELDGFITDLKSVQAQMLTKQEVTMNWSKGKYNLDLYDFNSKYLYIRLDDGYTMVNVKTLTKLIESLSTIEIGKDTLKTI